MESLASRTEDVCDRKKLMSDVFRTVLDVGMVDFYCLE